MTEEDATKAVISNQLPAIARAIRLGEISVDNIDVFCEKDVFELDSAKQILEAGRALGFRMNFHADEIHPLGGAEVSKMVALLCIPKYLVTLLLELDLDTTNSHTKEREKGKLKFLARICYLVVVTSTILTFHQLSRRKRKQLILKCMKRSDACRK